MKQHERPAYMLKHGKAVIKNAVRFVGIPYDGAVINSNAYILLDILSAKRKGKKTDMDYTDQLNLCIEMIYANYDFIDFVSGGDEKINALSGMNSRKNSKPRTQRPKKDAAANWIPDLYPNRLVLGTSRDETSRVTAVISSSDEGFKVERLENKQIKISLGDKSCLLDLSTSIKMILQNQKGGKITDAYLTKFNANGLSPTRKLPPIAPNIDGNYIPVIPPIPKEKTKDLEGDKSTMEASESI